MNANFRLLNENVHQMLAMTFIKYKRLVKLFLFLVSQSLLKATYRYASTMIFDAKSLE